MTKKQEAFIQYYYRTRNGSLSARLSGYSPKTADQIAYSLLRKPYIRSKLEELFKAVGQTF